MALALNKLPNEDVDALADFISNATKTGKPPAYSNYPLSNDPTRQIGIMRVTDFPRAGLTTAITFGLMHYSFAHAHFPDRIELLMVLDQPTIPFEKILIVVADMIVATSTFPKPGAIFGDACKMARVPGIDDSKPHALVTFPFLWRDGLVKAALPHATLWFHQVVPIFEKECAFVVEKGFATFEDLLSYDVLDLQNAARGSHVL